MKPASFNFLAVACLVACACSSGGSDDGGNGGTGATGSGATGSGGAGGSVTSNGGSAGVGTGAAGHTASGGSGTSGGAGGAGGIAGTTAGGAGGAGSVAGNMAGGAAGTTSGGTSAGGAGGASGAGSGGSPASGGGSGGGLSTNPTLSTHPVSVSAGKVYNVKDDFFNDVWVPRYPVWNYGFPAHIIPNQRADGSLDVAWLDYANGAQAATGLDAPATIYVTHVAADLSSGTTASTNLKTYRLLGFTSDPSGNYYIAYNADSPLKTNTKDDPNNASGSELRVAKFTNGDFASKAWDSLLFGDMDLTKDHSKGDPGGAGSGVLGYDTKNQQVVLYVSHNMAWGDNGTRHQAGFIAYIDPATGKEQYPDRNLFMGANWFYSHNFNQRLKVEPDGTSWILAHGDAYPRQLGICSFTYAKYKENSAASDTKYFDITGGEGDNNTSTETGQFVHLSDGRFVIVHTSSLTRTARDVHVVLTDTTGKPTADAWLTTNKGTIQAVIPKLELLGQNLWVTYGLWDSNETGGQKKVINWYSEVIGTDLKVVSEAKPLTGVEFDSSPPLFRFTAGPNAGGLGWVSGNANHTLTVNLLK